MDFGLILVVAWVTFFLFHSMMEDDATPPGLKLFAHIIVGIACILLLLFMAWLFYELVIVG